MASSTKKRAQAALAPAETWVDEVFLKAWRPYAWIAAAGVLLYWRVLYFGFAALDDNTLILDNYSRLRDPAALLGAFRHDVFNSPGAAAFYRPILIWSLGLDAQLGGLSPFVFHLDNIVIHLAATCIVFALLAKLGYSRGQAFFASLVFDVHPVLSQAVAWVACRNDSLAAVFVLLSFLQFVRLVGTEERPPSGGSRSLHLLFFALALFTKETAAVLVLACLAYSLLIAKKRTPPSVMAGWLAVLVLWGGLRRAALAHPLRLGLPDMARSVWLNFPALLLYLGKILLPFNLSVLPTLRDATFGYGIAASLAVLLALALSKGKRPRRVAFGLFWFALFLLPSFILHFVTMADFLHEHRTYLPMTGFLIVCLETDWAGNWEGREAAGLGLGALILLCFSFLTYNHIGNFKDGMSFWKDAARTSPHLPLAHRNLGAMYYLDGQMGPAEAEDKTAIALNPAEPMVHSNLGLIYMNTNRLAEAEGEFRREIAFDPGYENGYFNLGLLYDRLGRTTEAVSLWEKTVELDPGHRDANADLAIYYGRRGDSGKAAFYLGQVTKIDPRAALQVSSILAQKPAAR